MDGVPRGPDALDRAFARSRRAVATCVSVAPIGSLPSGASTSWASRSRIQTERCRLPLDLGRAAAALTRRSSSAWTTPSDSLARAHVEARLGGRPARTPRRTGATARGAGAPGRGAVTTCTWSAGSVEPQRSATAAGSSVCQPHSPPSASSLGRPLLQRRGEPELEALLPRRDHRRGRGRARTTTTCTSYAARSASGRAAPARPRRPRTARS